MALKRLQREIKEITKEPNPFYSILVSENNIFHWKVLLFGPPDTIFEGAIINAEINFPSDYPNKAPEFKFTDNTFHPNIYPDGKVCISILHEGVDEYGYEGLNERWNPSQSVDKILISILSIIPAPNFESPANVDASKMWRDNFNEYKNIIYKMVSKSQNKFI
jgi:ubiquitin-protein ligase